jgi:Predicted ATPase (AAA+ superfamily)
MIRFVDRESELRFLESEYQCDSSSLVILHGRRRVGKTALLSEFIKKKRALYFLVTEESEAQNRMAFQRIVADATDNSLLKVLLWIVGSLSFKRFCIIQRL